MSRGLRPTCLVISCRMIHSDICYTFFSEMMLAVRLINALTRAERCEECTGCRTQRCGKCYLCEDGGICLATVCVDGLDKHQKKALRLKHAVFQEDETHRAMVNCRLMQAVYLRAHKDS